MNAARWPLIIATQRLAFVDCYAMIATVYLAVRQIGSPFFFVQFNTLER